MKKKKRKTRAEIKRLRVTKEKKEKKKRTKVEIQKLKKSKDSDQERRKFEIKVRTQLDNAVYSFMYTVASRGFEVDKDAEEHITELFFADETIERCTRLIREKKMAFDDLITLARKIGEKTVDLAGKDREDKTEKDDDEKPENVTLEHLKQAIESLPKAEIWFEKVEAE